MACGDLKLLPLGHGEKATVTVDPSRGFDLGAGPGKRIAREVRGGSVGLILDARGRSFVLPEDRDTCRSAMTKWVESIGLYPEMAAVASA